MGATAEMTTKTEKLTTVSVSARLEQVRTDVLAAQQRQEAIEAEIAQRWGQDNAALESEYAALSARLKAAERVLKELQQQHRAAHRDELLERVDEAARRCVKAAKTLAEADKALGEAYMALVKLYQETYIPALEQMERANYQVQAARDAAQREGLSFQQTEEVRSRHQWDFPLGGAGADAATMIREFRPRWTTL